MLTTPLLQVLAQRHGPVDVVTTPAAAALLETHPAVRRVLPYDKRSRDRGLAGLWALARRLRAERYEVAYLPHRSLRTAVLARLAGIPRRVGFTDGARFLYTEARPRPAGGHEIDRLLALAGAAGGARPSIVLTPEDRTAAEEFLTAHRVTVPFVALAPGSIWGSKRWPYYPELAAAVAARAPVVVIGSPDDASLGAEVVRAGGAGGAGRVVNACGRLSLRESVALIARAGVLVTNDSAPLHFAQAVGTPTVAIFGPTIPGFGFGPRGERDQTLGVDGLACRPCSRHGPPACPLGHHLCLRSLEVARVVNAIEETGALHRRS